MTPTYDAPVEALALVLHDNDDMCNANYVIGWDDCAIKEVHLVDADAILTGLRQANWALVARPVAVMPIWGTA